MAAGPRRVVRLLPTPTGTPFTFGCLLVLLLTSLFARYGEAGTVGRLLQASGSDAAQLARMPVRVLLAGVPRLPGGPFSPYAVGLVAVLTALERRIGAWRTAAVFVLGHVVATLATEIPVGLSVLAGHLLSSSLHRLDYGVGFGLLAALGALAGLLGPLARVLVLGWVAVLLAQDLVAYTDPLTAWGHPLALLVGLACRPLVRRAAPRRTVPGRAAVRGPATATAAMAATALVAVPRQRERGRPSRAPSARPAFPARWRSRKATARAASTAAAAPVSRASRIPETNASRARAISAGSPSA
ncbi:rhomboid-like protein [Streptomyces sp. NPDC047097]|uniref:rhomboid-like protein n=1 Tax=Streptomyces sp. NPDC047097 TaxID=3155260 RepID=UPI0033D3D966